MSDTRITNDRSPVFDVDNLAEAGKPCDVCRDWPPGRRHIHWITVAAARSLYPDRQPDPDPGPIHNPARIVYERTTDDLREAMVRIPLAVQRRLRLAGAVSIARSFGVEP